MADQVTNLAPTPEDLERDMAQTRESLTEKVTALENQVVGSVQSAADTLTETVDAVKSFVHTAPEAVSQSVREAASAVGDSLHDVLDVSSRVRRNPWASIGVSLTAGCLAGWLASRSRTTTPSRSTTAPQPAYRPEPVAREPQKPGIGNELFDLVGDHLKTLVRTALESVSTAIKDSIQGTVPRLVGEAASRLHIEMPAEPTRNGFSESRIRV